MSRQFPAILPRFDPGNTYSITIQWGTTGLIVRTWIVEEAGDQLERPLDHSLQPNQDWHLAV